MIETLFVVVLFTVIALVYSWAMTLFMVIVLPLLVFSTVAQSRVLSRNIARDKAALDQVGKVALDSIDNIRTVAGLGVEKNFCRQYSERIKTMYM